MVVKFKKNVALFLIGILLSLSICNAFHCDVLAASTSGTADAIGRYFSEIFYRLCNDYGYVFDDEKGKAAHDFIKKMSDGGDYLYQSYIDSYNNIVDGAISSGSLYYDSATGNIKISDATYKQLGNWLTGYLDEYFAQETNLPDVVWMPVISASEFPTYRFYSLTQYYQFRSYADDKALTYVCASPHVDWFKMFDFSNFVIIRSKTVRNDVDWQRINNSVNTLSADFYSSKPDYYSFYLSNRNGVTVDTQMVLATGYDDSGLRNLGLQHKQLCYNWDNSFDLYLYPMYKGNVEVTDWWSGSCNTSNGWLVCSASEESHYIPIFSTTSAYKQWVTGQSDYYRVTPTYDGGDITINPNADYSKVYNNITTTIQNNYADGKDYSDILAAIQLAYAEAMKEISAGLDDIGDNTEESNSWLEKIYNQVTDIDEILEEQFNSMISTITDGFNSVIDALHIITIPTDDDSGGNSGGDSGTEKKSFWTRLGEFCSSLINGILSLIETIFMKALDGLLYLSNIVVDNASLAFDGLTERFERLSALFGGESLFGNLRDAIPEEVQDILVMFMFGIVASGVVLAIKR